MVAQLLYLEAQDPDKDIQLYINSPGGSVTDGMAIYDTMQYVKCDVSTICIGMAASMGAFLLCSGAKGKRMALPNAEIMIHQPSAGTKGKVTDMAIDVERFLRHQEKSERDPGGQHRQDAGADHGGLRAGQLDDRRGGHGVRPDRQDHHQQEVISALQRRISITEVIS